MTPPTNKPTLGELFDLPEYVGPNDFVLKLTEAITRPEATVKDYVVTEQLCRCFDDSIIRRRIFESASIRIYPHKQVDSDLLFNIDLPFIEKLEKYKCSGWRRGIDKIEISE